MKKLISILVLAGALSIPSAVFAEASWYGSLRGGVTFGAGEDARFMDGGSRWGIKGSHDLGDGLSATYRFEHKFSTENASLGGGGRLANIGLSGGFGSLTLGQVWSASYNATGAITDNSFLWGDSATSYRVGNALSYAVSAGSIGMQVDALMDSGTDTGGALDGLEFGLTVDLGDIGKVAFSHVSREDANIMTAVPAVFTPGTPPMVTVTPGTEGTPTSVMVTPGMAGTPTSVMVSDGTAGTPTSVMVSDGTAGTPTSVDVTDGTPGMPTSVVIVPAMPATEEMQATWQHYFEVGDQQITFADPEAGTDGADETPPTQRTDSDTEFQAAYDMHIGVFTPTAATPVRGTRGTFDIINQQGDTTQVNVFVPIASLTVGAGEGDDRPVTLSTAVAADEDAGTPEIPANTPVSDELAAIARANADRSSVTIDRSKVTDYQAAMDATPASVSSTGGTAGTPTGVVVTNGTAGTPTGVVVTNGTAGTPTGVVVTPGTAGTPTGVVVTPGTAGTPASVAVTPGTPSTFTPAGTSYDVDAGYKSSHVAAQFGFGGLTLHLGQSESTANDTNKKTRVTHYGVAGSLGDTGLNYLVQARKVKAGSASSDPWLLSINKSLGDGATAIVEHANADGSVSGKTWVGLKVDF